MPKEVTHYVCQKCGWESPKWQGQCQECGEWNSLVETVVSTTKSKVKSQKSKISSIKPLKLSEVETKTFSRVKTEIRELDRVLGGGIVPGSVVLIAGEPGIGKSTLLTQLALKLLKCDVRNEKCDNELRSLDHLKKGKGSVKSRDQKISLQKSRKSHFPLPTSVLYVCGEESPSQIKIRVKRLVSDQRLASSVQENLSFLPETNIESILSTLQLDARHYSLIIVDSIQILWTERLTGTAGSVGQIRECSNMLLEIAKRTDIPVFLIGHITKEGAIAGPKVLEHLVDTVLYLEGDRQHEFRILRASKNRFGPTDEVGVFIMESGGLKEISDPSRIFLSTSRSGKWEVGSGRVVTVAMQGIRPMLVEIQALVVPSQLAVPRRVASGIDYRRLQVLCAVLQRHCHIPLSSSDVFVNVAGGLVLSEPAADLGICLSIASSFKNKPLPDKSAVIGEVGLLGEIRKVSFMEKRVKEARKLGYRQVIGDKERSLIEVVRKYLKN